MNKIYLDFLKTKAEKEVNGYFHDSSDSVIITDCRSALTDALFKDYSLVASDTLDRLFMLEVVEKGLIEDFLNEEDQKSDAINELAKAFFDKLLKDGDSILEKASPTLCELLNVVRTQFFSVLDEFLTRFAVDKSCIENELFDGRKISKIENLSLSAGDKHNHGRGTTIVKTDAGKFVYRPRSMQIDVWMDKFFRKFFSELSLLPKVVEKGSYGYCTFIENVPADTVEKAAVFFENYGGFCAVSLLIGSRDLHMENILSDGVHPVPIDLEMMISPLEKTEKLGASPKDRIIENTILGSGFMANRLEKYEIGALFSTEKDNLALPVINGKKINVAQFEKEFVKGFEKAYRKIIEQRDGIIAFFDSMPDLPIRTLMRNTQAYAVLMRKSFELGWLNAEHRDKDFSDVLTRGFDKLGEKDIGFIVESEKNAIFEANIPMFFTTSRGYNLYDCDGLVKDNYFGSCCIEHVRKILEKASEREMNFEIDIFRQSIERFLDETATDEPAPVQGDLNKDCAGFHEVADKILLQLAEHSIITPDNDYLWFFIDENYKTSNNPMSIGLAQGLAGIGVFAAAESAFSQSAEVRALAEKLCSNILNQIEEKLDVLLKLGTLYENVMPSDYNKGLEGIIRANELIALYTGNKGCGEKCGVIGQKLQTALSRCDTSMRDKPSDKSKTEDSRGKDGLLHEDFLSGGNCGTVDSLLEEGIRTGNALSIEAARETMRKIISRAQTDGFSYLKPGFRKFFEASLFTGAAGIGYECLRCSDPERVKTVLQKQGV